ncbi:MAG: RnfABCDGE type electron transport complex subunit G [Cyclobacteriaceae bacterium]|nr:RnfABCDGE type electron transport complex subunit G [Cyclobacteriaceae bacterium]
MAAIASSFKNMTITLVLVTLVAAVSMGYVFQWTKVPIAEARLAKQLKAIEAVVKGYDNNPVLEKYKVITPDGKDSLEFFPAKADGNLIGMAVKTRSSKGYSGDIWLMVGFSMKGEILKVYVVEHRETPGLGSKMTDLKFYQQFVGKNPEQMKLKVKKDGGDVDAISGATISSRAYAEAVQLAYDTFKAANYGEANQ